jgi:hypothetical protein
LIPTAAVIAISPCLSSVRRKDDVIAGYPAKFLAALESLLQTDEREAGPYNPRFLLMLLRHGISLLPVATIRRSGERWNKKFSFFL